MWRLFLILVLVLGRSPVARANELDHTVVGTETLVGAGSPYTFHVLTVPLGTELVVEAGVTIQFTSGGQLRGGGTVRVQGTVEEPVRFTGAAWKGVAIEESPHLSFSNLTLEGVTEPLHIRAALTHLDRVTLFNSRASRLNIRPSVRNGVVHIRRFTIRPVTVAVESYGVHVTGPAGQVTVWDLLVPRSTEQLPGNPASVGGGYEGLSLIGGKTEDGCGLRGSFPIPWESGVLVVDPGCQPKEPSLVFVPGYGTSLNLQALAVPAPANPVPAGWALAPLLTEGYQQFFAEADRRNLSYTVAHYDWRLPPAAIVEGYLIPLLNAVKARTGAEQVSVVAHSFGGLVVRWYIQSAFYQGDIADFVMVGTPNAGAVKAYAPWQAAVFPPEWRPVHSLVRFYQYRYRNTVFSDVDALRTFFPSARALQPQGAVLEREGGGLEHLHYEYNTHLEQLFSSARLLQERVPRVFTVAGTGRATAARVRAGQPNVGSLRWPDGQELSVRTSQLGDGTVLASSVQLLHIPALTLPATHAHLPGEAAAAVLARLYPAKQPVGPPPLRGAARGGSPLWFTIDCPVTVTLTTPSGQRLASTMPETTATYGVFTHPDLVWLVVPPESGTYHIVIRALAETPVRWWEGDNEPVTFTLNAGEERTVHYNVAGTLPSALSASSPDPSPSVTPFPPEPPSPSPPSLSLGDMQPLALGVPNRASSPWSQHLAAFPIQKTAPSRREKRAPYTISLLHLGAAGFTAYSLKRRKGGSSLLPHHPP